MVRLGSKHLSQLNHLTAQETIFSATYPGPWNISNSWLTFLQGMSSKELLRIIRSRWQILITSFAQFICIIFFSNPSVTWLSTRQSHPCNGVQRKLQRLNTRKSPERHHSEDNAGSSTSPPETHQRTSHLSLYHPLWGTKYKSLVSVSCSNKLATLKDGWELLSQKHGSNNLEPVNWYLKLEVESGSHRNWAFHLYDGHFFHGSHLRI